MFNDNNSRKCMMHYLKIFQKIPKGVIFQERGKAYLYIYNMSSANGKDQRLLMQKPTDQSEDFVSDFVGFSFICLNSCREFLVLYFFISRSDIIKLVRLGALCCMPKGQFILLLSVLFPILLSPVQRTRQASSWVQCLHINICSV